MILEAAIGVCIHEWSKIQYVNKGVVKRSLIGSSTWVIGPADLSGFHSIYKIGRRQRKYRLSNAHEIRKYFGNYQTTNWWEVLGFCFVRTAPFLNITTLRKCGPSPLNTARLYFTRVQVPETLVYWNSMNEIRKRTERRYENIKRSRAASK